LKRATAKHLAEQRRNAAFLHPSGSLYFPFFTLPPPPTPPFHFLFSFQICSFCLQLLRQPHLLSSFLIFSHILNVSSMVPIRLSLIPTSFPPHPSNSAILFSVNKINKHSFFLSFFHFSLSFFQISLFSSFSRPPLFSFSSFRQYIRAVNIPIVLVIAAFCFIPAFLSLRLLSFRLSGRSGFWSFRLSGRSGFPVIPAF
jgi:hypothetical protein